MSDVFTPVSVARTVHERCRPLVSVDRTVCERSCTPLSVARTICVSCCTPVSMARSVCARCYKCARPELVVSDVIYIRERGLHCL